MSERLRPRDLALLAAESPHDAACTTRPSRSSTRATSGFDYDAAGRADRRPDRVRAALPPAPPVGAGPARQPGLGRRPGLRPRLPRTPLGAAAPGHPRPAARAGGPHHLAAARPQPAAVGGLLRRGPRRRPGRAAVEVPPDPRRRRRDRRPRPGAARRRHASPRSLGPRRLAPAPAPDARPALVADAVHGRRCTDPTHGARAPSAATPDAAARAAGDAVDPGRPGSRAPWPTGDRSPTRPITGQLSQQRRFVAVRTDLADYRTIREVHGGTVNDVILATVTGALRGWLMTRAESMGGLRQLKAVVPMSVIDDELEATSLGTPDRRATWSTCRSARPARSSACTRSPTPSRRTRRPAARVAANRLAGHRRLRARRPSTPSARGSPRPSCAAASSSRHQRARAAVPALRRRRADGRDLPRAPAAARPRRWRSA